MWELDIHLDGIEPFTLCYDRTRSIQMFKVAFCSEFQANPRLMFDSELSRIEETVWALVMKEELASSAGE